MTGTVIGVLRGGPSHEHDVSLKTGATIIAHLPADRFAVRDIYIDKQGQWHDRGRPVTPVQALQGVDAVMVGLHGEYGSDGQVQRVLEQVGVPFTGADSFGAFFAAHKALAKKQAEVMGLKVARGVLIENLEGVPKGVKEAVNTFMQPVVVKPVRWGSSARAALAHGFQPVHDAAVALLTDGAGGVLVEEYIRGIEAKVGVVDNLRGEEFYALPAIEVVPQAQDSLEIVPGRFSRPIAEELARAAKLMHGALGQRHYSRSDFIVSPKGIYYLETNTFPALGEGRSFSKGLNATGIQPEDFLSHLVTLALG